MWAAFTFRYEVILGNLVFISQDSAKMDHYLIMYFSTCVFSMKLLKDPLSSTIRRSQTYYLSCAVLLRIMSTLDSNQQDTIYSKALLIVSW